MKLISWNVNGLRAVLKKAFEAKLAEIDADVVCLQETKVSIDVVEGLDILGEAYPHQFWACAEKKGYSGTAVFSRRKPLSVRQGLGVGKHDREGRVLTVEFPRFTLVNVYTPNARNELLRLPYRADEWDVDFRKYLARLDREKPVVFCGDLNVAHEEIDLARPKQNRKNAGFTDEERQGFSRLLEAGFVDTFRAFHPDEPGHYSWWSYRGQARARNIGWRLDYFGVSNRFFPKVKEAFILKDVDGSDHVPVGITLKKR